MRNSYHYHDINITYDLYVSKQYAILIAERKKFFLNVKRGML